jgi:hypothetical protein
MAERESALAERERQDAEKAAAIEERRVRLGHDKERPAKSKAKPKAKDEKKEESEA